MPICAAMDSDAVARVDIERARAGTGWVAREATLREENLDVDDDGDDDARVSDNASDVSDMRRYRARVKVLRCASLSGARHVFSEGL